MAEAIVKVSEQYDHAMNPKVLAWVNLAMVAGGIYGTRVVAIRARLAAESKAKGAGRPVVNIEDRRPVGAQGKAAEQSVMLNPSDVFGLGYGL